MGDSPCRMRQAGGLGLKLIATGLSERVVAAGATGLDIGLARNDQAGVDSPLEQRVERAGRQTDRAAGELGGTTHDRIAMKRPVDKRGQREVARCAELHIRNDTSIVDM